jgi:molybdopterin biosynthesis enzyme
MLEPGERLRPQDVAAIASTGATGSRFMHLKVALISTGDEIVRPGNPLGTGRCTIPTITCCAACCRRWVRMWPTMA